MSITDAIKNSVLEGFNTSLSTTDILLGLGVSALAGLFILFIYRRTMRQVAFNRSFCVTLMLVCVISAMVVLTITSNLALSLGMVGALSIIRFRTALKDPSDTAFMFWAVAAGITAGAGFYQLTLIGCLFIAAVCLLSSVLGSFTEKPYLVVIRAENKDAAAQAQQALKKSGIRFQVSSLSGTADQVELICEAGFRPGQQTRVLELERIAGVTWVSVVDCRKS